MAALKTSGILPTTAAGTQTGWNQDAALDVMNRNRYTQEGGDRSTNQWITNPDGSVTNKTTMGAQPQAYYDALMGGGASAANQFNSQYWGGGGGGGGVSAPSYGGGGMIGSFGGGGAAGPSPVGEGIQKDLDYSKLTAMPGDTMAERQNVQDALYKRNTGYLDPQFAEQQRSLATQLSNKGFVEGTPAFDLAMRNHFQNKERAYTGARQDAIAGSDAAQERMQNMMLQLRNQGVNEAGNLGGFHNAAQAQGANQWLTQHGQDTAANAQIQSAGIGAGAHMESARMRDALDTRIQKFNEIMGMGKGAQSFLPQFDTGQGNLNPYKPGDIQGAAETEFRGAASQPKKQGFLKKMLPVLGTVGGSFFGPWGAAAGSALGRSFAGGSSGWNGADTQGGGQ